MLTTCTAGGGGGGAGKAGRQHEAAAQLGSPTKRQSSEPGS
jgi:hypothetical protein